MKRISLLLLTCFISTFLFAGDGIGLSDSYAKKKRRSGGFDKSRIIVGGGLGGGSIQGGYIFSVTPSVGYQITDRFHAGVNVGYFYSKVKDPYDQLGSYQEYRNRTISTSLYARFFPLDVVFLQVNPELNFVTQKYKYYDVTSQINVNDVYRFNIPAFLVGGGYAQRLGGRSYMMLSIMYDLVQNANSPYYRQPIFGGGLALGLFGN